MMLALVSKWRLPADLRQSWRPKEDTYNNLRVQSLLQLRWCLALLLARLLLPYGGRASRRWEAHSYKGYLQHGERRQGAEQCGHRVRDESGKLERVYGEDEDGMNVRVETRRIILQWLNWRGRRCLRLGCRVCVNYGCVGHVCGVHRGYQRYAKVGDDSKKRQLKIEVLNGALEGVDGAGPVGSWCWVVAGQHGRPESFEMTPAVLRADWPTAHLPTAHPNGSHDMVSTLRNGIAQLYACGQNI